MPDPSESVEAFSRDVQQHEGYVYTSGARLSSRMATQRWIDAILALGRFEGRRVLDLGCGDGFHTLHYWDRGRPSELVGLDASESAIAVANERKGERPIRFEQADAHRVPFPGDAFDLVLLQGLLHHTERPQAIVAEALRMAPEVLILEPNGCSPILKVIERVSAYHREHGERSFACRTVRRWVWEGGGETPRQQFVGAVPIFCPDGMARVLKRLEPLTEATPLLRSVGCGSYLTLGRRRGGPGA